MMILKRLIVLTLFIPSVAFPGDEVQECFDAIFDIPEIAPIAPKVTWKGRPSFELLANTEKATEAEKPLISRLANELIVCQDMDLKSQSSNVYQKMIHTIEDYYAARINRLIDLYNQKITYGENAKLAMEQNDKKDRKMAELERELDEMRSTQEAENRQAWSRAIGGAVQGLQNTLQQNRQNSVNCRTTRMGDSVYTNCK